MTKVKKLKTIKYKAGDLVNQAKPKTTPKIMARSYRGFLAKQSDKYKDKIPKNDNRLSAVARRSKKKVKGKNR